MRLRRVKNVARTETMRRAYKILVGKSEANYIPLKNLSCIFFSTSWFWITRKIWVTSKCDSRL